MLWSGRYDIVYRQAVSSEDMYLGMSGRNPSSAGCEEMVVRFGEGSPNSVHHALFLDEGACLPFLDPGCAHSGQDPVAKDGFQRCHAGCQSATSGCAHPCVLPEPTSSPPGMQQIICLWGRPCRRTHLVMLRLSHWQLPRSLASGCANLRV